VTLLSLVTVTQPHLHRTSDQSRQGKRQSAATNFKFCLLDDFPQDTKFFSNLFGGYWKLELWKPVDQVLTNVIA
jgi:hypothetical protein